MPATLQQCRHLLQPTLTWAVSPALVQSQLHHCCHCCCCWLQSVCCPDVAHCCRASAVHLQLALRDALLHMLSALHTHTQRCWLRARAKHVSFMKLTFICLEGMIIVAKCTSLGEALAGSSGASTRVDGQLTRCGGPASPFCLTDQKYSQHA